ncbi:hypothetical protein ACSSS7_001049 [Eimeria intestinalis]
MVLQEESGDDSDWSDGDVDPVCVLPVRPSAVAATAAAAADKAAAATTTTTTAAAAAAAAAADLPDELYENDGGGALRSPLLSPREFTEGPPGLPTPSEDASLDDREEYLPTQRASSTADTSACCSHMQLPEQQQQQQQQQRHQQQQQRASTPPLAHTSTEQHADAGGANGSLHQQPLSSAREGRSPRDGAGAPAAVAALVTSVPLQQQQNRYKEARPSAHRPSQRSARSSTHRQPHLQQQQQQQQQQPSSPLRGLWQSQAAEHQQQQQQHPSGYGSRAHRHRWLPRPSRGLGSETAVISWSPTAAALGEKGSSTNAGPPLRQSVSCLEGSAAVASRGLFGTAGRLFPAPAAAVAGAKNESLLCGVCSGASSSRSSSKSPSKASSRESIGDCSSRSCGTEPTSSGQLSHREGSILPGEGSHTSSPRATAAAAEAPTIPAAAASTEAAATAASAAEVFREVCLQSEVKEPQHKAEIAGAMRGAEQHPLQGSGSRVHAAIGGSPAMQQQQQQQHQQQQEQRQQQREQQRPPVLQQDVMPSPLHQEAHLLNRDALVGAPVPFQGQELLLQQPQMIVQGAGLDACQQQHQAPAGAHSFPVPPDHRPLGQPPQQQQQQQPLHHHQQQQQQNHQQQHMQLCVQETPLRARMGAEPWSFITAQTVTAAAADQISRMHSLVTPPPLQQLALPAAAAAAAAAAAEACRKMDDIAVSSETGGGGGLAADVVGTTAAADANRPAITPSQPQTPLLLQQHALLVRMQQQLLLQQSLVEQPAARHLPQADFHQVCGYGMLPEPQAPYSAKTPATAGPGTPVLIEKGGHWRHQIQREQQAQLYPMGALQPGCVREVIPQHLLELQQLLDQRQPSHHRGLQDVQQRQQDQQNRSQDSTKNSGCALYPPMQENYYKDSPYMMSESSAVILPGKNEGAAPFSPEPNNIQNIPPLPVPLMPYPLET